MPLSIDQLPGGNEQRALACVGLAAEFFGAGHRRTCQRHDAALAGGGSHEGLGKMRENEGLVGRQRLVERGDGVAAVGMELSQRRLEVFERSGVVGGYGETTVVVKHGILLKAKVWIDREKLNSG